MSRRAFTLDEKRKICNDISKGKKNSELCKEYNVSSSTISTIVKNRDKWFHNNKISSKSKRIRESDYEEIDKALLRWFKHMHELNVSISGPMLRGKANKFGKLLGLDNFECSPSWIQRFRERHGITYGKASGESGSVTVDMYDDWLQFSWPAIRQEYSDSDIFNADEAGIFFKLTPDQTLRFKNETCTGGKLAKDRLTILVCANMSGTEKRPLLVIGKCKKPRCFKNVKQLPVEYTNNKAAWMTSSIFEEVLHTWDRELQATNRKILLLVDNCSSHVSMPLECIRLEFLPPNTTSILQPMDQGIIKCLKGYYRKMLVLKIIENLERKIETKITVLDAMIMLRSSWDTVSTSTIKNCFIHSKLRERDTNPNSTEAETCKDISNELQSLIPLVAPTHTNFSSDEFLNVDDAVVTSELLTDQESLNADLEEIDDEHSNNDETASTDLDMEEFGVVPTIVDARMALNVLKAYCLTSGDSTIQSDDMLRKIEGRIEDTFRNNVINRRKQTVMDT